MEKTKKPHPQKRPCVLRPLFRLVVDCRDEADQKRVYEHLTAQGRKCRILTF